MLENLNKRFLINEILVDLGNLSVQVGGSCRSIEAKHAALLRLLITNHGEVVTRELILNTLWPGTIVSDNSVSQLVAQLRRLLDDSPTDPKIIKTVPRLGYQCIAHVERAPTLLEHIEEVSRGRGVQFALLGFLAGAAITLAGFAITQYWQQRGEVKAINTTRITSAPGAELFIRFSPNGKYLVYSYLADGADQFDLAVYDLETKTTHTIKSSGYSEESASWSADGKWLIYSRSDPVSCEIRALDVKGPVEMWRLARDTVLDTCNSAQDSAPWLPYSNNQFITKVWDKDGAYLQSLNVSFAGSAPKVIHKTALPIRDVTHYDVKLHSLLYQIKEQGVFLANLTNLNNIARTHTQIADKTYTAFSLGDVPGSVILAANQIEKVHGANKQLLYASFGSVTEIDFHANTEVSAHTEGVAEINYYQLELSEQGKGKQTQLTSPSRMDLLATLSQDGLHFVYASIAAKNEGFSKFELWHKYAYRPTSSLLGTMPEGETPVLLLLSPSSEYLAVLSKSNKVYLVSSFTKEVKKIIDNFSDVASLRWSSDSRSLRYQAKLSGDADWQNWLFDISQGRSEQAHTTNVSRLPLAAKNQSFKDYQEQVQDFLIAKLASMFDVEQLRVSLSLYQPAVYQDGIYFILKRGHQLVLYRYLSASEEIQEIQAVGLHLYADIKELQVLSSFDGSKVIFNRINNYESDIVLLKQQ
ncbi:winged helix-turn-helix domain-containing protein [Pseudoalteromonas sp. MMG022]|uniref:winged helix-turn-helix domain-containing protein n=1 Tax=Pseudoalteromonas sp. MMG022 TaxID=2909978 RepID=UPI001F0239E0|nr:winged helix-turn-helix domain-containing protein [Pseudoalteromonas sp. MMG022]MCF6435453.1 winged helix-turn-helix domain-containing protein [Pseudoalteromonas sp. MMG022]